MLSDYDLLPSFRFLLLKTELHVFLIRELPSPANLLLGYTQRRILPFYPETQTLCPTLPFPLPPLARPPGKAQAEVVVRPLNLVVELGLEHFLKQVKLSMRKIFRATSTLLQHCCWSNWKSGVSGTVCMSHHPTGFVTDLPHLIFTAGTSSKTFIIKLLYHFLWQKTLEAKQLHCLPF